jgi:amidase
MARLPQVNIPTGRVNGCPVGLSLIGPRGSDRALLRLAVQLS